MIEAAAANAPEVWDRIWTEEGPASWRGERMANVYARIAELVPEKSYVTDLGGGIGQCADALRENGHTHVTVVDQSRAACDIAENKGHDAICYDAMSFPIAESAVVIGTEFLEHLADNDRDSLLERCSGKVCFWSVPNNRLGPDEETQHTIKWTAVEFLGYLRRFYDHVRVECIDDYLLAVCGVDKGFRLSVCTPARDEADDMERVLRSFRGVADELVVGIDPRSQDRTEEIARRYADVVFELADPVHPPADDPLYLGDPPVEKVHFAWIRNQCMDRCTGDWIFMTEAHEHLADGVDEVLRFAPFVPPFVGVLFVTRSGQGQEWQFPWICRNDSRIRYRRGTHNSLTHPDSIATSHMPNIRTSHDRSEENAKARDKQRKAQNRKHLMEDWTLRQNTNSLFYLGQEWRNYDPDRAIRYFEKFMATEKSSGPIRYQARLIMAKLYARVGRWVDVRKILLPATGDDWQRTEHWLWLGDEAFEHDRLEEALAFYQLAASRWPERPRYSLFWYDVASYTFLLAQRMVMAFGAVGRFEDALLWSERVIESLPEDCPEALKTESIAMRDRIAKEIDNGEG